MAAVLPLLPGKGFMRDLWCRTSLGAPRLAMKTQHFSPAHLWAHSQEHRAGRGHEWPFSTWIWGHSSLPGPSDTQLQQIPYSIWWRMSTISYLYFGGFFLNKYTARAEIPKETRQVCSQQRDGDSHEPQRGSKRAPQELICVDELPGRVEYRR